jgi:hypothetical protein
MFAVAAPRGNNVRRRCAATVAVVSPAGVRLIGRGVLRTPARGLEIYVLNKFGSSGQGEAKVQYLDGDFRVISPGAYVRCAVTGTRIPLEDLKYWSVDRQEAYATPEAVLERHQLHVR